MAIAWILTAFVFGFLISRAGQPPLLGFLAGGFLLNAAGLDEGREVLTTLADIGVTLLLFSIGLKLKVKTLARPEVWGAAGAHLLLTVGLFGVAIYLLAIAGVPLFDGLDLPLALLVAFALSFSSTVFAVKVLEDKGELDSRHGRVAIGILIMQDIAAVLFMVFAAGKVPSPWALLLFLLIPLRRPLFAVMTHSGHGEMLLMFGLALALGGSELFELVGVKGDLGALLLGLLVSTHPKASELSHALLGFKDLFLVAFFLSIGLSGQPNLAMLLVALGLALFLLPVKLALFHWLLSRFHLRARTTTLASLSLCNFSEFGLIIAAVAVGGGWIPADWLIVIAIALALSFVIGSPLNSASHTLYARYHDWLQSLQSARLLPDDQPIDAQGARMVVFGMGRVGQGAYQALTERFGKVVLAVDSDPIVVEQQQEAGRRVILGDGTDSDFWEKVPRDSRVELVLLALPNFDANLEVAHRLRDSQYPGRVAATVKFSDEVAPLKEAGVEEVFNIYDEAGIGFADHALHNLHIDHETS